MECSRQVQGHVPTKPKLSTGMPFGPLVRKRNPILNFNASTHNITDGNRLCGSMWGSSVQGYWVDESLETVRDSDVTLLVRMFFPIDYSFSCRVQYRVNHYMPKIRPACPPVL